MARTDGAKGGGKTVRVGCRVKFENASTREIFTYTIVQPDEASPGAGTIASDCPLAISALGRQQGETAVIHAREEVRTYRILFVEAPDDQSA